MKEIKIAEASCAREIAKIRELFLEYAESLEISLCFQNFEEELSTLPGKYAPPPGRLLLAMEGNRPAGCVALRPLEKGGCEMKRLFVRPAWRGKGLGRLLGKRIIAEAMAIGYESMRLDTLNSMKPAIALYRSFGFEQIGAYYSNPSDKAVFMELRFSRPIETGNRNQSATE